MSHQRIERVILSAGGADLERLVAKHVDQVRRLSAVYETKVAAMK